MGLTGLDNGPMNPLEVVQHVMEHSSRPGDRQHVMNIIRKNILSLSCPKPKCFAEAFFSQFLAVVDFGGTKG